MTDQIIKIGQILQFGDFPHCILSASTDNFSILKADRLSNNMISIASHGVYQSANETIAKKQKQLYPDVMIILF